MKLPTFMVSKKNVALGHKYILLFSLSKGKQTTTTTTLHSSEVFRFEPLDAEDAWCQKYSNDSQASWLLIRKTHVSRMKPLKHTNLQQACT